MTDHSHSHARPAAPAASQGLAPPGNDRPLRQELSRPEPPEFDPYHKWLGIPPEEQPPHHYRLLGLQLFEADPEAIESLAEQRSLFLQSCQCGTHVEESQRLLDEIAAATLCLLNPVRKQQYDHQLRTQLAVGGACQDGLPDAMPTSPAVELIDRAPIAGSRRRHAKRRRLPDWLVVGAVVAGLALVGLWLVSRPSVSSNRAAAAPRSASPPDTPARPPADQPSTMPFQPEDFTLGPLVEDGLKLAPVGPQRVAEGEELTVAFPLTELPISGAPVYHPEKLPPGAQFDSQAGVLTWTPGKSDGPGTYAVTVRVSVPGRPELADQVSLTIHVVETNPAGG